jgi:SHS2 domain-containing protein
MKRGFTIISHTADIGFIARGRTLTQLAQNSSDALLEVMFERVAVASSDSKSASLRIKVTSVSRDLVLWKFLQNVLSEIQGRAMACRTVLVKNFGNKNGMFEIDAVISLKRPEGHFTKLDVKAVTPHNLKITKKGGVFYSKFILDI